MPARDEGAGRPGGCVRPMEGNVRPPRVDDKEARRRRREIFSIFLILFVLLLLTVLEFSLGRFRAPLPFNDSILFFSIININIILILLLIFLVLRNVVKLVFERRQRILGAQLRNKLVAAFVLLSLVPTGILFYVAWSFISRSIEMWVHVQVERALEGSLAVARTYYKSQAEDTLFFAKQIKQALHREGVLRQGERDSLKGLLRLEQVAYRLDAVYLVAPDRTMLVEPSVDPALPGPLVPEQSEIEKVRGGQEVTRIRESGAGELIEAIVPIGYPEEGEGQGALVVQRRVQQSLIEKMAQISQSLERHKQMMLYEMPFKSVIFMALILVTLLILFSATWFGFFLAKGITTPIQHLAQGIREVAAGNLTYRIETASDDEMGILVDSFNQMIMDLKEKGLQIEETQGRLHQSNVELEQRRRYMEILLRNIGAGVMSLDREGRIQTLNRFMERQFGIRASSVLGKPYGELFAGEAMQPVRELIEEMNQGRARNLARQIRILLQQEYKNFLVRGSVLEDEEGDWMGVVMVFEDHSELIRAQRAAAWREVARRIAHEIKNPLTPIQLSAQRLQKRYAGRFGQDGKVFEECTNTIIRQVEEMKNLVSEFSQFARMPAANPVFSDLNRIVHEVIAFYQQAHLPRLLLDPDQIRRVLINLLDNALDATDHRGPILLLTRFDPFLRIGVLEVVDEGAGISREMRERIFEPYTSTKKGGTGLGLAIVKTIVADHNGYIRVRDNKPKGTRFVLEFPIPIA
jgi:two-component system nitrogen regulation sensor histidine kinase NtrY